MSQLVLLRHGQSTWNLENRFTGWVDVDLTEKGRGEAKAAGALMRESGCDFDMVFTSLLKRAIRTMWFSLDELDRMWVPVIRNWHLNERHYGALTGLDKAETAKKHGDDQVKIWRRSYDVPPPPMEEGDPNNPSSDVRYAKLEAAARPLTECLKDTVDRVVPYWDQAIAPELKAGKRVLIVAHGNSLRALVKHLEGMSEEEVLGLNIPTGAPRGYDFDSNLKVAKSGYLGDPEEIARRAAEVANQGKSS
ncbi:MAG: 2,3-diphosphoglycerate-dependent phosphoglycerate mutase [Planctomycetota bacterium]